jgi:hypothetical protein
MADVQNDQRENSLTEAGLHNIEIREDEPTYVGRSEAATGDVSQDEAGPEDVSQHEAHTITFTHSLSLPAWTSSHCGVQLPGST